MDTEDMQLLNKLLRLAALKGITVGIVYYDDMTCYVYTNSPAPQEEFSTKTYSYCNAFECAIERLEAL